MSYTLTFDNINEQDVIDYEKNHNVNLREFIENLIKPKAKTTNSYSQDKINLAKERLNKQFGEFAYLTNQSLSAEEINQRLSDYFEKEWKE